MWLWLPAKGIPMSKSLWNYLYPNVLIFLMVSKKVAKWYRQTERKEHAQWKLDYVESDLKAAIELGDPEKISYQLSRYDMWWKKANPDLRFGLPKSFRDDYSSNVNAQTDRESAELRMQEYRDWHRKATEANQKA